MEDLMIIGAGGSSQQIAGAIEDINLLKPTWKVLGFLDDDPAKLGQMISGLTVLGPTASAKRYPGRFIIGLSSVRDLGRRKKILAELGLERDRFATVIHPSAIVSRYAKVGVGTAILQNVVITQNTIVGDHTLILHNVSIGHDVTIEDFVTIAPASVITGFTRLYAGCYVGAGSAINNGRTVNERAVVGLGSVVVKDVPAGVVVVGNPARPLPGVRRAEPNSTVSR